MVWSSVFHAWKQFVRYFQALNQASLGCSPCSTLRQSPVSGSVCYRRSLVLCAIVGLLSGLAAVAFHKSIHWVSQLIFHSSWVGDPGWWLLALPFIPALGGLLVGIILVRFAPTARGSGIPQVKMAFYNNFGYFRSREGFMRFILGVISIGTGTSLGREGPTVHICATIASKVGQLFGLAKPRIQAMVPVGMGAGIAAAFNTPLAAITFVFEELLDDFSSKALGGILISVVIASVVTRALLGENPAFQLETYVFNSYSWTAISMLVGVAAGFLGHAFTGTLLHLRQHFKVSKVPLWLQPALGGLSVGLIGTFVLSFSEGNHMGIFGIGYDDLSLALKGSLAIRAILFLLIGKFVATILAYSMGGSGGLFAPVLFIGGMLGGLIGSLCQYIFGFDQSIVAAVALLGMGAFFAAVIRCPLTSLLIIFELTWRIQI
jgi:chloride channel protein, CIC family